MNSQKAFGAPRKGILYRCGGSMRDAMPTVSRTCVELSRAVRGRVSPHRATDLFGFIVVGFAFVDMRADHAKAQVLESPRVRDSTK